MTADPIPSRSAMKSSPPQKNWKSGSRNRALISLLSVVLSATTAGPTDSTISSIGFSGSGCACAARAGGAPVFARPPAPPAGW